MRWLFEAGRTHCLPVDSLHGGISITFSSGGGTGWTLASDPVPEVHYAIPFVGPLIDDAVAKGFIQRTGHFDEVVATEELGTQAGQ